MRRVQILRPIRAPIRQAIRGLSGKPSASWTPARLFSASEQGAWYDPSDFSSMFQDSAGTTPVTAVEQPVGLLIDKRLGGLSALGAEQVVNGDFASSAGWTIGAGWSVAGGVAVASAVAGFASIDRAAAGVISGRTYQVTCTISSYSAGQLYMYVGSTGFSSAMTANGTYTYRIVASAGAIVALRGNAGLTCNVDNFSVKEVPGNHATQATSTARPTLRNRYNLLLASATLSTQNVTTVATNYQLRFSGAGTITLSGTGSGVYSAGTHTITCTAGTLTLTVAGSVTSADLLYAADASLPYQSITTATSYDSTASSFPIAQAFLGTDDSTAAGTGGGGTTAGTWVIGFRPDLLGTLQAIWSDAGTNTGYRIRFTAANQIEFSAGNGAAYTAATVATALTAGQRCVITAWHDGANLNVQVDNGTVATAAFVTATAGTAAVTLGKDNGAASGYLTGRIYDVVYVKDVSESAGDRALAKTYVGASAGVVL